MTPFDRARQVHLPELLREMGHKLTPQGHAYSSSFCPKCGQSSETSNKVSIFPTSGKWRWKCFSCGTPASSSIDWVAAEKEVTAIEAVAFINGNTPDVASFSDKVTNKAPVPPQEVSVSEAEKTVQYEAFAEVMAKVTPGLGCEVAVEYLDTRGLPKSLVQEAHRRKLVFSLPKDPTKARDILFAKAGEPLLRKAGCIKPASTWPGISFRPIIFPQWKTGGEFRIIRKPRSADEPKSIRMGRLHTPWWWPGTNQKFLLVVEGAVDGLSVVQMGWKGHVMALPGVTAWNHDWLSRLSLKYPGIELFVGLDNDPAGTGMTREILEKAGSHGIKARRFTPNEGVKDWNDALRAGFSL